MKIFVVYDTVYGNTEKIAEAIKEGVGKEHTVNTIKATQRKPGDLDDLDFLFVGSPTHGGWYVESIKSLLAGIPENGLEKISTAAFDTGSFKENEGWITKFFINLFGYASPRIAKALRKLGASVLSSKTFFVIGMEGPLKEGEEARARAWAADLIVKVQGAG